ncbi:MAG: (Fe-S)-binding protein [Deltaproteobacteria bacterium]|nr:MAG: (Fe-S)-binding protein [Deltaproteobacteria bacterium]
MKRARKPQEVRPQDIGLDAKQLVDLDFDKLPPLPPPYEDWRDEPIKPLSEAKLAAADTSLDGFIGLKVASPASEQEKERAAGKFLDGLQKLFSREDNWTFLQPWLLAMESCVRCNTCADACPIFESSGRAEIYRPLFRAEVIRRLAQKNRSGLGRALARFTGANGMEVNWPLLARLAELAYRCTLCRRCAQHCPMGVDNGLVTREIRKLFSQELGWSPAELHDDGTMKQLTVGSSTGINRKALDDILEFAEEDIEDRTGMKIKIPVDREGADILIMHNAGEFLSWPENLEAFAILFELAGLSWTISGDLVGYDSVNYGLFYDDVQYTRVTLKHAEVARKLGVKKVVMGECGHAHKAFMATGDRMWIEQCNIPRESALTLMEDLVCNEKIMVDPRRNDFPVTLHDPCNIARSMGIVMPQRNILKKIAPRFREMEPHGVDNYCCGGGSGFAIMQSNNFPDWRMRISGRKKFAQILNAFQDCIGPETNKYVCAPCSNCKGQIRDLLTYYQAWDRCHILYGGLVELIVNAMVDVKEGFLEWEFH